MLTVDGIEFFLESDGTKVTITDSDFEDSVISGNSVILTKNHLLVIIYILTHILLQVVIPHLYRAYHTEAVQVKII